MKKIIFALLFIFSSICVASAKEQIELVVPYGAGGGTDLLARRIAAAVVNNKFELFVTNRTGGASNIALTHFVNSKNKILILAINQIIENEKYAAEGYPSNILDVAKPIYFVADGPQLLFTSLNISSFDEMVKLSETKDIVFGSNTPGTASFYIYDQLCNNLKVFKKCNLVTYRSSSAALPDLFAQRIDVYPNGSSTYNVFTDSGKSKAIIVIGKNRFYGLPNLPSIKEKGYDIDILTWFGLFHKGLTKDEFSMIHSDIKKLMTDDEYKKYGYLKIEEEPNKFFQNEITKFRSSK
jgi:tripartite-type tricarboxylate transporter receptor subunit TctC